MQKKERGREGRVQSVEEREGWGGTDVECRSNREGWGGTDVECRRKRGVERD